MSLLEMRDQIRVATAEEVVKREIITRVEALIADISDLTMIGESVGHCTQTLNHLLMQSRQFVTAAQPEDEAREH